ncbi:MAG: TatD family hydrolase [Bacilli bacterium]|nr:TatD family hydrolase [Bacilli bacterium]
MIIDTHCHLEKKEYDDLDSIIRNMNGYMIASGYNDETNLEVIELVNKYDKVYGVIGIHPEEVNNITSNSFKIIEENVNNPKIVGIGEIGLDYYYVKDNKEQQKELFKKQIKIAEKYHKPIVVHSRDAAQDTYEILKDINVKCDIHCFSYSLEMAKEFTKLGFKLGIGGVLTFKNSKNLKEVVAEIDIENFLLETDSPYLTPEPFRGKKNNPANVELVAKKIAEMKHIPFEEVIHILNKNAIEQFDLDIKLC